MISAQRNISTFPALSGSGTFFLTEGTCRVSRRYESAGLKDRGLKGNLQ